MTTFYKNYVSLCAERKKSLSKVAEEVGLSRTAPNGWKKGKIPSEVTLEKLSQYFQVPISELTNKSEQKEKPTPKGEPGASIDDWKTQVSNWNLEELADAMRFLAERYADKINGGNNK